MYGLWSLACIVTLTLWHAVRVSVGAVLGVPDRRGGLYDREPRAWARDLLRTTGLPVDVTGLERLDPDRPYVYAANHASFVDIWVLLGWLPGSLGFIAKRELFSIPVFGRALRATGQIALDRQDLEAAATSYTEAARDIRGGRSVIVFVEGTRVAPAGSSNSRRAPSFSRSKRRSRSSRSTSAGPIACSREEVCGCDVDGWAW